MDPKNMTAAQLLDATIEAMVAEGPDEWFQLGDGPRHSVATSRLPACVLVRAGFIAGDTAMYGCSGAWHRAAKRLGFSSIINLNDSARDFEDCIERLRQVKALL